MQNRLLGSLFKKTAYSKQLVYGKQLIRISFSKIGYSKQLIYAKQLIRISFSKTAYSKQLIYEKQLIRVYIKFLLMIIRLSIMSFSKSWLVKIASPRSDTL